MVRSKTLYSHGSGGAWVRFLVGELDPVCCKERSHVLQLRPGAAKEINKEQCILLNMIFPIFSMIII